MTQRFDECARERLEAALSGLADDASDGEVLGAAALGIMALHRHYGGTGTITLDLADVDEYIDQHEPTCICPPEMVARGGYRSVCSGH